MTAAGPFDAGAARPDRVLHLLALRPRTAEEIAESLSGTWDRVRAEEVREALDAARDLVASQTLRAPCHEWLRTSRFSRWELDVPREIDVPRLRETALALLPALPAPDRELDAGELDRRDRLEGVVTLLSPAADLHLAPLRRLDRAYDARTISVTVVIERRPRAQA